eukprot:RCo031181
MVDKKSHIELHEPKTDGEWEDYAVAVAAQISRAKLHESKAMGMAEFLGVLLERACASLGGAEMQKLSSQLLELSNTLLEAEKKAAGQKKKKKTKYVSLDGGDDYDYDDDVPAKPTVKETAPPPPEIVEESGEGDAPAATGGGSGPSKLLASFLAQEGVGHFSGDPEPDATPPPAGGADG